MRKPIIAVILALSLLLTLSPVRAASGIQVVDKTGDGEWTDNTWQVEIYPGENKSTTLNLYNSSSSSLGVEVSVSPDSLDGGNLTFKLDKANFTMPGRSYTDITLTVKAHGSATLGTYTTQLEIKSEEAPAPRARVPRDVTPPIISGVSLWGVTETAADISWITNELSTSQVEYWTSPSMLSPLDEAYVLEHHIQLADLTPDTIYYYTAMSMDKAGNLAVSNELTFTTLKEEEEPPLVKPTPPPEEEEPEVVEPEAEEPEIVKPEEPVKPYIPPEEKGVNWPLLGGITAAVVVVVGLFIFFRRRRNVARGKSGQAD